MYCPACKGKKPPTGVLAKEEYPIKVEPLHVKDVPALTPTPVTEEFVQCKRKDCFYRSDGAGLVTCDYILKTGQPRGCSVEHCDKYKTRGK